MPAIRSPLRPAIRAPLRSPLAPALGGSPSLTAQVQALFAGGKVGGMWDLSDMSTLYQNNMATSFGPIAPVTTNGQAIGHVCDTSVTTSWVDNSGSVWIKNSGDGVITVVGNTITITGATTITRVDRIGGSIPFANGTAKINITASWTTAAGATVWLRGYPTSLSNGVATTCVNGLNNSSLERVQIDSGTATFTINSLQYWEGNHAYQTTAGAGLRPLYQLAGGYGCAQFDGTDDALMFPAITFGGAFNTFVAGKVTSGTQGVHLWRTADVNGTWAKYKSGDITTPTGTGSGSPTYAVNGTALSPSQQGQLYTQINGVDSVVESIGVVLTAETALQFSGFVGSLFAGNAHRVLMISGTLTAGEKLLCRQWCAQGNGVTVV